MIREQQTDIKETIEMDDPQIEVQLPDNICGYNSKEQCERCSLLGCECAGIIEEEE